MSIQNEIERINLNISNSYVAIQEKGGTVPQNANSQNLAQAINSIPTSGVSVESITITSQPNKISYYVDDIFDPTGMAVYANFSNGKSMYVNHENLTFDPSGPLTESDTFVTVNFQWGTDTVTATQSIIVIDVVPETLNECSWLLISKLSQSGTFLDYFSVGDTKTIVLNGQIGEGFVADNLEIDLVVVGINHNAELEGNNLVHFMIGYKNGALLGLKDSAYGNDKKNESGYFTMNPSNNNTGGWAESHMRSAIMGGNGTPTDPVKNTLMAALPTDLRNVMRSAKKWTNNVGGSVNSLANITETTEFLCPIDEYELDGTTLYAYSYAADKQNRYQYFLDKGNNVKILDENGTRSAFYFRGPSPHLDNRHWDGANSSGVPDFVSQYYGKVLHALIFV